MFEDRDDAGARLAERLSAYAGSKTALVLGIPRGGVVVGSGVSRRLGLPLDVFISLKLRAPGNEELAVGAMTELGNVYIEQDLMRRLGMSLERLGDEFHRERQEIEWRRLLYRGGRDLPEVAGRDVILVDDGLATGCTMLAAAEALRPRKPRRLIAAVPVAPADKFEALEACFDETVVLKTPVAFDAVGAFYRDFWPVPDAVVLERLSSRAGKSGKRRQPAAVRGTRPSPGS